MTSNPEKITIILLNIKVSRLKLETGNKLAKFHENTPSPSENIARGFRERATFLIHTVHATDSE